MLPRGSMLAAVTRLMMKRSLTTWVARANAASVAALSPSRCTKQILLGQPSNTSGAPGASGRDGRRQFLVLDLDQLGGVGGLVIGLRHHEGDTVADPAHAILHQRWIARAIERRSIAALEPARNRQIAKAGG